MFEKFARRVVRVPGVELNVAAGGDGPPLLLLHGYPQTHVAWHRIAPDLVRRFTVVVPDLPGYGDSSAPRGGDYSKRAMAGAMVELMAELGFDRFAVAGHDRGGRVAYRLALDHPDRIDAAGGAGHGADAGYVGNDGRRHGAGGVPLAFPCAARWAAGSRDRRRSRRVFAQDGSGMVRRSRCDRPRRLR